MSREPEKKYNNITHPFKIKLVYYKPLHYEV